jgi:NAD(P)-dependent dehydrogenase (short-subunit alcohol dehydrogenase family)
MSSDLGDRTVAIVTGSSSGIGQTVVQSLLARSFFVVAAMRLVSAAPSRWPENQNVAVQALEEMSDESVVALAKWLRDDRHVQRCDVLVNNSGFGALGTIETVPLDAAMRFFDVNVWGVVRMCKAVLVTASNGRLRKIAAQMTSRASSLECWS